MSNGHDPHSKIFEDLRRNGPGPAVADVTATARPSRSIPLTEDIKQSATQFFRGLGEAGVEAVFAPVTSTRALASTPSLIPHPAAPLVQGVARLLSNTGPFRALERVREEELSTLESFYGKDEERAPIKLLGLLAGGAALSPIAAARPSPAKLRLHRELDVLMDPQGSKLVEFSIRKGKGAKEQVLGNLDGIVYADGEFKIGNISGFAGPGTFGPGGIRKLLHQLRREEPTIKTVGGFRVSGARRQAINEKNPTAGKRGLFTLGEEETLEQAFPNLNVRVDIRGEKGAIPLGPFRRQVTHAVPAKRDVEELMNIVAFGSKKGPFVHPERRSKSISPLSKMEKQIAASLGKAADDLIVFGGKAHKIRQERLQDIRAIEKVANLGLREAILANERPALVRGAVHIRPYLFFPKLSTRQ